MDLVEQRRLDDALVARLAAERTTWDEHWKDLCEHFLPRSSRFSTNDKNRGSKKNSKLLNGTPARAARTLAAGLFSQITSPARPWFNFGIEDRDLAKFQPVKEWLDDSTRIVRDILAGSNYYKCSAVMFRDLGVIGTHAQLIDEDADDVVRCYPFPIGSYYITNNHRLAVDLCVRRFSMTARQLVERFGKENVDHEVRDAYKNRPEQWFDDIVHICGPNAEYDPDKLESRFKRYSSRYYRASSSAGTYLSIKGYDEFPIIAPRWSTTGEDVYGESPAMLALPDARSLMVYEKRIAQAIEKKVNPPLRAPLELEARGIDPQPGKTIFAAGADKIGSLYDLHAFQIDHADAKAMRLEQAISSTLYVDLFLMLMSSDRRQITAEEIRARQEEKILALGEPLERLNDEALGPGLERVFSVAARQGRIPPPPQELMEYQRRLGSAKAIKVEYVSALHQVQRMVKIGQIDRAVQYLNTVAGAFPDVLDNFDADESFQEVGEALGLPPRVIRSKDQRTKIRQERAAAQAKQAQMQQAAAEVQGAHALSQIDTSSQNGLTDLMRSISGVA